jgi:hypothetical protein
VPWRYKKRGSPVTLVLTVGPDTAATGAGGAFRRPGGRSTVTQNVVANEEMSMTKNQHRSFAAWLRNQRRRDDPAGDLARDAAADRHRAPRPQAGRRVPSPPTRPPRPDPPPSNPIAANSQ